MHKLDLRISQPWGRCQSPAEEPKSGVAFGSVVGPPFHAPFQGLSAAALQRLARRVSRSQISQIWDPYPNISWVADDIWCKLSHGFLWDLMLLISVNCKFWTYQPKWTHHNAAKSPIIGGDRHSADHNQTEIACKTCFIENVAKGDCFWYDMILTLPPWLHQRLFRSQARHPSAGPCHVSAGKAQAAHSHPMPSHFFRPPGSLKLKCPQGPGVVAGCNRLHDVWALVVHSGAYSTKQHLPRDVRMAGANFRDNFVLPAPSLTKWTRQCIFNVYIYIQLYIHMYIIYIYI